MAKYTILCSLLMAVFVAPAFGFDETVPPTGRTCSECHGLDVGETTLTVQSVRPRQGPHGGYTTGTQKCQTCHTIHNAPLGSTILLPAHSIRDTCLTCHDGTGGKGVYGTLAARGIEATSGHRIEWTNLVPGGDPAGGAQAKTFLGVGGLLTCSDCHSPHGADAVRPFTGDRIRASAPQAFPTTDPAAVVKTDRLLKRRPTTATRSVDVYGSDWCASCHQGRLLASHPATNHPVTSNPTNTAGVHYDRIRRVAGANTTSTVWGTLGASNRGFVMPTSTVPPRQAPICQQCHEDPRSVGNDPARRQQISTLAGFNEEFRITAADGAVATDNPRFQVFPHESAVPRLLVEDFDSLCLNCHSP